MKVALVSLTMLIGLNLVGCASTKFKTYSDPTTFKSAGKTVQGKTPKEAAQILGKPMSAFYKNGDTSTYHMVYPMGEKEVGMADLMFNDRLECLELIFEKEKSYKFDNWVSNTGFTCGAIKREKLDTSLIDG